MTYRIDACVKLIGSLLVEADSEREALEQAQEIALDTYRTRAFEPQIEYVQVVTE